MNFSDSDKANDESVLSKMGYSQELFRGFSGFSNFALSFSIICILVGGITSFHLGFCAVGPAAIGIGWPVAVLFSLCVAATMAQIASAFPTSGGLYHWASLLGGRAMGWITAWLNLAGLVTVLAAINVGTWRFVVSGLFGGDDPGEYTQVAAVALITLSQIFLNLLGTRYVGPLTSFSGWWILGVSVFLVVILLACGEPGHPLGLLEFHNFSGYPAMDEKNGISPVWPITQSMAWLFLLALLLPAFTITGFDASAHAAEETRNAAINVPRGIMQSVLISGIAGWILLGVAVLVIDDHHHIANQGERAFVEILEQNLPGWLETIAYVAILVAQYFCGMATITSASRMVFAFARDGGLPASQWLRQVRPGSQVPANAVWVVAIGSVLFTAYADVYATITAACTIFLYLSYVLPTFLGLMAHGRSWTAMGPWQVGIWFKPLAILSIVGSLGLLVIGTQPPSEKAGYVVIAFLFILVLMWLISARKSFKGPPVDLKTLQGNPR
ncbi:MAG: amino acid permease [Gemmataceae bacterium]|nr:amino acid permease [Gemmataceae bacterium]